MKKFELSEEQLSLLGMLLEDLACIYGRANNNEMDVPYSEEMLQLIKLIEQETMEEEDVGPELIGVGASREIRTFDSSVVEYFQALFGIIPRTVKQEVDRLSEMQKKIERGHLRLL